MKNNFSHTVLIAKCIGIILVVIGHFTVPTSPIYWEKIKNLIYSFHMPLFFLLSGYLFNYEKFEISSYIYIVSKKIKRLFAPFVSIALIFFALKYFSAFFVKLQHPVTLDTFLLIFVNPVKSYMPLLWFIYVLMLVFIFYPLLLCIFKNSFYVFFVSIMLALFAGYVDFQPVQKMMLMLPYFSFGNVVKNINFDQIKLNNAVYCFVFFVILFALSYYFSVDNPIFRIIIAMSGSMSIVFLSSIILSYFDSGFVKHLESIGYYSMSIYLFHTLFVSAIRIISFQFFKIDLFLLVMLIAVCCGVLFPFLLEKYFLRKNSLSRRYILGLS
jgi:fucose 4-O-acetylase-like acetyltransferase